MARHPFISALQRTILAQALLPTAGTVVIACSGGADSLALLHGLHAVCGQRGTRWAGVRLHVAHLDHGLRGADGAEDAAFVAAESARLGLPCTVATLTSADRAGWRGSLEAAARRARYALLHRVAQEVGASQIAVGHTADDQAETILFHLMRGSGVEGLVGMHYVNGQIIRPMLDCWRADTESYCAAIGLRPRHDATNADPRFTRNRLRHEVLPLLEAIHPGTRQSLVRTGAIMEHVSEYLATATAQAWLAVQVPIPSDPFWLPLLTPLSQCVAAPLFCLERTQLRALAPAIRQRVLARAIALTGGKDLDAQVTADSVARLERVVTDHSGVPRVIEFATGGAACLSWQYISVHAPAAARQEISS